MNVLIHQIPAYLGSFLHLSVFSFFLTLSGTVCKRACANYHSHQLDWLVYRRVQIL